MPDLDKEKETFEYDLFIGYIGGANARAAQELRRKLQDYCPRLNLFEFEVDDPAGRFTSTRDELIQYRTKCALFLVSKDSEHGQGDKAKYLRLYHEDGEERESAKELKAIKRNRFMERVFVENGLTPAHMCVIGPYKDFDPVKCFDPEDELWAPKGQEAKAADWQLCSPFYGAPTHHDDGSFSEAFLEEIVAWVNKVREKFFPIVPFFNKHIYWVGTRQSDVAEAGDFIVGSVCLFGDNDPKNRRYSYCTSLREPYPRIDHNVANFDADMWVYRTVSQIAKEDPDALFYAYNPAIFYDTRDENKENPYKTDPQNLLSRVICLNDEEILETLRDKKKFRDICQDNAEGGQRIHLIESVERTKAEIEYKPLFDALCKPEDAANPPRFVIQAPVSSGGVSTFILDSSSRSQSEVRSRLEGKVNYICTVYQEHNVPVNVHAIIFKQSNGGEPTILLSTPSIQLSRESMRRILYRGADFIEAERLPQELVDEFLRQAREACHRLYHKGFYGICGIDGILCDLNRGHYTPEEAYERTFLLEVNSRFQASTALLNRGLKEAFDKDPTINYRSMQYLNLFACYCSPGSLSDKERRLWEVPKDKPYGPRDGGTALANVKVGFSNFCYVNDVKGAQALHLLSLKNSPDVLRDNDIVDYELDGLPEDLDSKRLSLFQDGAHLYRLVFKTNICHINQDSRLYFHESILDEDPEVYYGITKVGETAEDFERRKIYLKVALLIQGVVFGPGVSSARPGTFQAVDILFKNKERYDNFVVNAPIVRPLNDDENLDNDNPDEANVRFTGLSPFSIRLGEHGELRLYYYEFFIDEVLFFPKDELAGRLTKSGVDYGSIAYLSTDRLRVHLTNMCKFKRKNAGCRFCGISCGDKSKANAADRVTFREDNVREVLSGYVDHYIAHAYQRDAAVYSYGVKPLRHFLLGGQTADLGDGETKERLIQTVKAIRTISGGRCDIYAMIVPCDPLTVMRMKQAGLTQLAFNIEIVDDAIAKQVMPGKREVETYETYKEKLKAAKMILNRPEAVRSMLLIGLEPIENTIRGVKELAEIGVQPMLSVFRPMPGTPMSHYMPPQISDVMKVYEAAKAICASCGLHLGPDCAPCQNNTVSLPYPHK